MPENKTRETGTSVTDFLAQVDPPQRAADALELIALMTRISGEKPVMWGPSIIGFGSQHYVYESGREGDMPRIAFAPRKAELVLYVGAAAPNVATLLPALGRHRTGKGCLYIKKLTDVDMLQLEAIIATAFANRAA